jgi:bifunctional DNA-binding transcriptional regulator/antitoxin component of YhaV-PrlF toxin-antitoxin module
MRFSGTLDLRTRTATTISVPEDVITGLGAGKRPRVAVTVTGAEAHSYSATVGIMAGDFLLPVSAEVRAAAGIAAGDRVDVDIELDAAPREIVVPADLADALSAEPGAREFFDGLSEGNRRRLVEQIESAKSDETRGRRLAKTVETMRERRTR